MNLVLLGTVKIKVNGTKLELSWKTVRRKKKERRPFGATGKSLHAAVQFC